MSSAKTRLRPLYVSTLGENILTGSGIVTAARVEAPGSHDWKVQLADADGLPLATVLGGTLGRSISVMRPFTRSLRIRSRGGYAGRVRLDIKEAANV